VINLRQNLEFACRKLANQPAAQLEAEILLAHVLESPRSFLYANPDLDLPSQRIDTFKKLVQRRARGEPIAYITGSREFWSLPLRITPDVLIPRHETELLVEAALQRIPEGQAQRVADLGSGSGAIALAIASERPACEVHGADLSAAAVALARENAANLGLESTRFHQGSWFEPLSGIFDMIVSNPPYIAHDDPHLQQGDCRFEPGHALTPGSDPLGAFREIAEKSRTYLSDKGWLLLEHGTDQASAVQKILSDNAYQEIKTLRDLPGHERVTLGRREAAAFQQPPRRPGRP
jgi:release factor glutamine methyltransferase